MRAPRVSESISVGEFQAETPEWLRRIASSRDALVIMQSGTPVGVVLSPEVFQELTEQSRFVAAVEEGLADAEAGRLHSHESVVAAMKQRFRTRGSP